MNRPDLQRRTTLAATLGAALLATACAAPAPTATVADPGARVEAAVAQRCAARVVPSFGAEVATVDDVRREDRAHAARVLGLDRRLQVVAIHAGSPADAAGLRAGDIVEAVDGSTMPTGPRARPAFLAAIGEGAGEPVLRVQRDGRTHDVAVPGRAPCTTSVRLPSASPRS
jgi:membrane-associated protease RseP (regulator of RpoE activity)